MPGIRAGAGLLLAAALAASCGGGGGSLSSRRAATTTGPTSTTSTTGAPTTAPAPASTLPGAAAATAGWTTYHGDPARSGVDRSGARFNPLAATWTSPGLDGAVYGQPLVWGGRVVVATANDTVYGLDAARGTVVWKTHLGSPVPLSALACGNVDPLGILSTPVIDTSTGRVFVVAEMFNGGRVSHQLVALDAATGARVFAESADPAGMNARDQQQRSALTLEGGRVYISYGGLYGDCGSYHGWVVSAATSGPGPLASYRVPTANEGAIWAPPGPTIDGAGDLLVATGNGSSTSTFDHGNAVIKLSPALKELDWFAPTTWAADNSSDADLGSTSPALLPGGLLFQVGKQETGYLLAGSALGHIGGQAASRQVCYTIGGDAVSGSDVYVPCGDGLKDVHVDSPRSFHVVWTGPGAATGPPIVAGGLVWSVDRSGPSLYGLDPATGRTVVHVSLGSTPAPYSTPAVGNGMLLVATGRSVRAFSGPAAAPR